jgi:hypothetical protein
MGQKVAAEQCMVFRLDGAAHPHALDALGAAAAGAMQGEPPAATIEPLLNGTCLRGIRVRAGDIGDQ